ncbi:MAG: Hdr-like menaquinol oxidoreductase cytochrome c subunit [Betaproteobacteria bacterium]|nr:Hdr-like menaquinol oxidoreductase cytochrome c subunit [Betaproteobacteria bacterium]
MSTVLSRLGLAIVLGFGLSAWAAVAADGGRVPKPVVKIERPGQCVAPPEVIRRTHMDLLVHQRDRTVHLGERGAKISLNGCIACHASKTTGSVLGSNENFCQSCHAYVAVKLDCFECHQPKTGLIKSAVTAGAKP